jgi:hypothetical protein
MKKLAEQTLKSKQHWLTGPENPQLFTGHCDQPDLSYKQPVQDQRRRKWLHAYDKRNAYLSAFSVTLGVGESIEVNKPCEFSQRPGLWQCEVIKPRARSQWDIITGSAESFSGWFYTPLVQYFQQREYVIKIKRAVLYSFGHRVLEPTYNILRVALAQIPQNDRYSLKARAVAVKCLKSCYTQFIGWLAGAEHSQRGGPFYRPDWRQTIIAEAQARMARNIDKAIAAGVDQPVGVDVDSVLFYSDEPDPARAVPAPFTGSSVYRLKYSVPGPVAAELLSAPGSIQKINMQLKLESESK